MLKRVLLDMDGVIANFTSYLLSKVGKEESDLKQGEYNLRYLIKESVFKYLKSWTIEDWVSIPKFPDADDLVNFLSFELRHIEFFVCTKVTTPESAAGKVIWLKNNFPKLKFAIVNDKRMLASKESLLIDDSDEQCSLFYNAGGETILVPRIWNARYDRLVRGYSSLQYVKRVIRRIKDDNSLSFGL